MLLTLAIVLNGCSLEPQATDLERARLMDAGKSFVEPYDKRQLPALPAQPAWQDVLQRAFLSNGELEAAYFQWQAAVHRITIESAYPNTNVQVGFDYMFSKENMKAWDRTTVTVGFDPAMMLQWPDKVRKASQIALEEARLRGERFAAVKFALQRQVLIAWLDYGLMAERVRIETENVRLLRRISDTAVQRVQTGAAQQDLLKAQAEYEMARNDLASTTSELQSMRVMLNGMLARPSDATLPPPKTLPSPRTLSADDAQLIGVAVDANPELAALAHEIAGRKDALELARMAYIPDIAPQFSMTGSISQAVGTMVSLPTNLTKIRGSIQEAESLIRSTEAMARQTRSDRTASFVAALYATRNHERQIALFSEVILPKARQILSASVRAYSNSSIGLVELVDSQRTLLEVRRLLAEAKTAREKRLAEMESLAGVDIETLGSQATPPATAPARTMTNVPTGDDATIRPARSLKNATY